MITMDFKMSLQCVIADPLIIRCFSHLRACQTQPDFYNCFSNQKCLCYKLIWINNNCDTNTNNTTNIFSKRKKNSDPIFSFW